MPAAYVCKEGLAPMLGSMILEALSAAVPTKLPESLSSRAHFLFLQKRRRNLSQVAWRLSRRFHGWRQWSCLHSARTTVTVPKKSLTKIYLLNIQSTET